jgi:hypothetical protein
VLVAPVLLFSVLTALRASTASFLLSLLTMPPEIAHAMLVSPLSEILNNFV